MPSSTLDTFIAHCVHTCALYTGGGYLAFGCVCPGDAAEHRSLGFTADLSRFCVPLYTLHNHMLRASRATTSHGRSSAKFPNCRNRIRLTMSGYKGVLLASPGRNVNSFEIGEFGLNSSLLDAPISGATCGGLPYFFLILSKQSINQS